MAEVLPDRVVWAEGLLLSPHHLQQLERYQDARVEGRLRALSSLSWGIVSLEVDQQGLEAGEFCLRSFRGVLPDGLLLHLSTGNGDLPPSRPIADHFAPAASSLGVYLAVARAREGVDNFAIGPQAKSRYARVEREVLDLAGSGRAETVVFGKVRVSFLFEDETRDDCEHIKVAELERRIDGGFALKPNFIPNCLRVQASPFLQDGLKEVIALMTARRRSLGESVRERDGATIEFRSGDVNRFLMLSGINRFMPTVLHLLRFEGATPYELYRELCQLAGQLGTFSPQFSPESLPAYEATALQRTFEPLFETVKALLRESVRSNSISIPLTARDHAFYTASMDREDVLCAGTFLLALRSHLPEKEAASLLPRLAKIASQDDIHGVLVAASPGVPVEATFRPPAAVSVKAGVVYFQLLCSGPYWKQILEAKNIAVYLPHPFEPAQVELQLIAIPREEVG